MKLALLVYKVCQVNIYLSNILLRWISTRSKVVFILITQVQRWLDSTKLQIWLLRC